jgi:hypothetical protein
VLRKKKADTRERWENAFKGSGQTLKTKQAKKYRETFGIEATIEMLVDASNYTSDEIWLFSYELFCKEVTKFDMKCYAESKEHEAEMELMTMKNKGLK